MREMLILILGLVVVAVVLRGLYLAIQARRGQIRLAIDRNIPQDVDLEELELAELPSGGARVVQRSLEEVNRQNSTQDELDLGGEAKQVGPIPILMDTVEVKEGVETAYPSEDDAPEGESIESIFADEIVEPEQNEFEDEYQLQEEIINEQEREEESEIVEQYEADSESQQSLPEESDSGAEAEFEFEEDEHSRSEPTLDSEQSFEEEFGDFSITAGERIGKTEIDNGANGFSQDVRQNQAGSISRIQDSTSDGADTGNDAESDYDQYSSASTERKFAEDSATPPQQEHTAYSRAESTGEVTNISKAKESRKPATVSEVKTTKPVEPAEVLVVNVMSREGELFHGRELLQTLITTGLKHGDMDIFHMHAGQSIEDPILFSVANILNPGTFDLNNMDEFSTRGVSLFLSMPSPIGNSEAFEQMLKTAQQIRGSLNGELKDDHRNVMTTQTIEHYRGRIHDFELHKLKTTQAGP